MGSGLFEATRLEEGFGEVQSVEGRPSSCKTALCGLDGVAAGALSLVVTPGRGEGSRQEEVRVGAGESVDQLPAWGGRVRP